MKILFLVPYPHGESPSQRFRFEQYLDILRSNGTRISIQSFWSQQTWDKLYLPGHAFTKISGLIAGFLRRVLALFRAPAYDFVFIHREATPLGPPIFEWILAIVLRKKIIYDFDDAIWIPNTSSENKLAGWLKWHRKVKHICRWSYRVSCGNHYLAEYARQFNKNVYFIPTTIDTEGLHNPSHVVNTAVTEKLTIGWTGTHSTIKYLEPLIPVLQHIEKKFPGETCFTVIADKNPALPLNNFVFKKWNKDHEIEDLASFDIGVMPLEDDAWAKGKCGFKALQYLALGIPAVVSPVGVNTQIVIPGENGFLASTPDEWINHLSVLIENKTLRINMGTQGRLTVVNGYSVISNSSSFLTLFAKSTMSNNASE